MALTERHGAIRKGLQIYFNYFVAGCVPVGAIFRQVALQINAPEMTNQFELHKSASVPESKLIERDLTGSHVEICEHFDCGLNHGGRTAEIILDAGWIGMSGQILF